MKKKIGIIVLIAILLFAAYFIFVIVKGLTGGYDAENWNTKLISKEYSDGYCKVLNYNFLTSNETYTEDGTDFVCFQEKAESGKEYLLFELEVEYVDKSIFENQLDDFVLQYGKDYELEPEAVYITSNKEDWTYISGEAINHQTVKIDPLSDTTKFVVRGVFEVSPKIEEDKDTSLVIKSPFGKIKLQ